MGALCVCTTTTTPLIDGEGTRKWKAVLAGDKRGRLHTFTFVSGEAASGGCLGDGHPGVWHLVGHERLGDAHGKEPVACVCVRGAYAYSAAHDGKVRTGYGLCCGVIMAFSACVGMVFDWFLCGLCALSCGFLSCARLLFALDSMKLRSPGQCEGGGGVSEWVVRGERA